MPNSPAARQRLALEEHGGVEQLLAAAEPQHPGLMQQRVDGRVATQRRGGVRERFASLPARSACRRPLRARIGFLRDTRRAIRVKRSGLPNDSTYSITAAVRASCSHHSSRSLVETSARSPSRDEHRNPQLPGRRMPEQPDPPPDCEPIARPPARTLAPVNVAFRLTSAAVFSSPHESGPTIRKPAPRTISSSRSSRAGRRLTASARAGRENEQRSRPVRGRLGGELEHAHRPRRR